MVDLHFRKELYPYESNMKKFEEDYKFKFGDGKKGTPRFCNYNGEPHVYLDEYIISALASTKQDKEKLLRYVKKNFKKGWDPEKDGVVVEKVEVPDPSTKFKEDEHKAPDPLPKPVLERTKSGVVDKLDKYTDMPFTPVNVD